MGFLENLFGNKSQMPISADDDIVAVANATMVAAAKISDETFQHELLGQTVGFELKDGTIVSPANGTLEVFFPTGHAFAIRTVDGTGLLVHIGIDTVRLGGVGFKPLVKQGDTVRAGQPIVAIDLDTVKKAGYDCMTMLVVTEPVDEGVTIPFIPFGDVTQGQKIITEF